MPLLRAVSQEEATLATLGIQMLDIWYLFYGNVPQGEMRLIERG